jgi:hypothetical protein
MSLSASAITLTPLPIGGAGIVTVQVVPGTLQAITAFIGPVAAVSATDTNPALVQINLDVPSYGYPGPQDLPSNGPQTQQAFWGAPMTTGIVLTVFGQNTSGVWDSGVAITGYSLVPFFSTIFPWDADWVVNRLQDVASTIQPIVGKTIRVTRSFPRDTHGWPALNVQVDNLSPMGTFIGDMGAAVQTGAFSTSFTKVRLWTLNLSITGWCATPEERSALGAWLGGAMEVVLDASRGLGWEDPAVSLRESEDFETLGVPAFLVTANLTVTVQSALKVRERNDYPGQT